MTYRCEGTGRDSYIANGGKRLTPNAAVHDDVRFVYICVDFEEAGGAVGSQSDTTDMFFGPARQGHLLQVVLITWAAELDGCNAGVDHPTARPGPQERLVDEHLDR